jgi:hypothetical protein
MMAIYQTTIVFFAAASFMSGCVATTPVVDARHGETLMTLKAKQTKDPAAALRNENKSVDGIEAQAASNAIDRYYKSFTLPPAPMNIINIGAPSGGASSN